MMILALGSRRLRLAPNRVRRLVVVNLSLLEHLSAQSERLCEIFGTDSASARRILADLLGPTGSRSLSQPPAWPSNVADDHTPVEFSVAFNEHAHPTLRI